MLSVSFVVMLQAWATPMVENRDHHAYVDKGGPIWANHRSCPSRRMVLAVIPCSVHPTVHVPNAGARSFRGAAVPRLQPTEARGRPARPSATAPSAGSA